ncbi:hypothetical protein IWW42_003442 [Coemansia sp. RSA 1085]|nr:hypothetical protein BX667DRAFT_493410 [Coemansia mojavensis]KAJ1739761.1 hypothetical protein LPJ68_004390 [Coemansia sp. RSA 1086]KAJ2671319.1 hypothetical protein IWW42_003442 [Coemansia sp. RSA 1085]
MFDYSMQRAYIDRYGQATSKMRSFIELMKKRRFDISIGLQSALSTVYAVELVFYFVRLRHLANKHLAAWRASIMLILLVVDIGLIWLTVRSKRSASEPLQHREPYRYHADTFHGYAPHESIRPSTTPSNMPELPPYPVSFSHVEANTQHMSPATHDMPLNNPFASHEETRAHLNKPITG